MFFTPRRKNSVWLILSEKDPRPRGDVVLKIVHRASAEAGKADWPLLEESRQTSPSQLRSLPSTGKLIALRCTATYGNVARSSRTTHGSPCRILDYALYIASTKDAATSPTRFGPTAFDGPKPYHATMALSSLDLEDFTSSTASLRSAINASTTWTVRVYGTAI